MFRVQGFGIEGRYSLGWGVLNILHVGLLSAFGFSTQGGTSPSTACRRKSAMFFRKKTGNKQLRPPQDPKP